MDSKPTDMAETPPKPPLRTLAPAPPPMALAPHSLTVAPLGNIGAVQTYLNPTAGLLNLPPDQLIPPFAVATRKNMKWDAEADQRVCTTSTE